MCHQLCLAHEVRITSTLSELSCPFGRLCADLGSAVNLAQTIHVWNSYLHEHVIFMGSRYDNVCNYSVPTDGLGEGCTSISRSA